MSIEESKNRVHNLMLRILPHVNIGRLPSDLRANLLREFPEMKVGGQFKREISFSDGKTLMWYDSPVLSTVRVDGQLAIQMAVNKEEAGAQYLIGAVTPQVMTALTEDRICLRKACLDEGTILYITDDCHQGTARVLTGYVEEYLLPTDGLFIAEMMQGEDADPEVEEVMEPI